MRDILFRAKRVDNGEWVYGDFTHDKENRAIIRRIVAQPLFMDENGNFSDAIYACSDYEVYPDTVSQFTGLCDKNGNRIFEGDIIEYEDGDPTDYEYHDGTIMNIGEIIFCDGGFFFTNAVSVTMDDLLYNNILDCEVMGNKWDNKSLLENSNE